MSIAEYTLDVGDSTVEVAPGEIDAVWIEGLRRPTKLVQVNDIWGKDVPFTDVNINMRGVPSRYVQRGRRLHFWPATIHRWKLLIEYR